MKFLTTKNIIDWNILLEKFQNDPGDLNHANDSIDANKTSCNSYVELSKKHSEPWLFARDSFIEIIKGWFLAGYDLDNMFFYNYYPEVHFPKSILETFENITNCDAKECWISRVPPFIMVPYHRDEFDGEAEWTENTNKKIVRYTCFIDIPIEKQILIVGDDYYELIEQHRIIKWNDAKSVHGLVNLSSQSNFLFHIAGIDRD